MYILSAEVFSDRAPDFSEVPRQIRQLENHKFLIRRLSIDPLSAGWHNPLEKDHYRSGCAPLEALMAAQKILSDHEETLVVIEGQDFLRSSYATDKTRRQTLMNIYGAQLPLPEAYTQLAETYLKKKQIPLLEFEFISRKFFENYQKSAQKRGLPIEIPSERFEKVTRLFRAVDCANPVVDFRGQILLGSRLALKALNLEDAPTLRVTGVSVHQSGADGPSAIDEISNYQHLSKAFQSASAEARVDFVGEFLAGRALLEAYTCFPNVPLAFLLECGFVSSSSQIEKLLDHREITVTGGMNLAKAAWNAPVLNALAILSQEMRKRRIRFGGVHGNGGLGYKQGFAVLEFNE
jgi:hypothetical protein